MVFPRLVLVLHKGNWSFNPLQRWIQSGLLCILSKTSQNQKTLPHLPLPASFIQPTPKSPSLEGRWDYMKGGMTACLLLHKQRHSLYTQGNIYSQSSTFIVHVHCVVFIVPYGLSFGATCAYSTAYAWVALQGCGADFLYVEESLDETKQTDLAITQNFIERINWFLYPQWNQPLNHAALLSTKPGSQSWFPQMPKKEKKVMQGHN